MTGRVRQDQYGNFSWTAEQVRKAIMLTIDFPTDVDERLNTLARVTGRSKLSLVQDAVLEHLADLEDLYLAEREIEEVQAGRSVPKALADVMKDYGLAD